MTTNSGVSTAVRATELRPLPRARNGRRRNTFAPYVLLSPALLLYAVFLLIPIGYAIYLSFQGLRLVAGGAFGKRQQVFVGFDNYHTTLADPEFYSGFGRLAIYGLIAVPVTLGLALLFALLIDHPKTRAKSFSRTAIFIPYAVPGVVASLLWGFMYLPSTSPFSYISKTMGGGSIPFLNLPLLFPSVANIAIWGGVGFNMIIIYTALRAVPADIYESARIDGASEWQIALRIKIPLVAPALVLTGLFSLIGTLQVYGEPTTLSPMTADITQTWVPLMKIYRDAFTRDDLPLASAASVLLALGIVVVSVLLLLATQRRAFGGNS
ncbi:multiple sugar transport system permease protein [Nakamurella sp. UYEF19]|uniref:carbohydrate ABC transporter permease n=1 Tax=Nakamurella sp. UYEF19 TaxID=1756392 RepID=UPI0033983EEF